MQELADLRRQAEALETELAAARVQIDELHQDRHRWWGMADQSRHELLAVYASKSWRLTAPLRLAALAGQALVGAVRRAAIMLPRLPRRIARAALLWVIRRTMASTRLKASAERYLAGYPRLRQRLRALAMAPTGPAEEAPAPGPGAPEWLSPRAAAVYVELKQAIAARRH